MSGHAGAVYFVEVLWISQFRQAPSVSFVLGWIVHMLDYLLQGQAASFYNFRIERRWTPALFGVVTPNPGGLFERLGVCHACALG